MLKQKVASLKNEQEQVKEQLRMSKVVYGKNSAQAKKLEKELCTNAITVDANSDNQEK